jgi:hypothetical protein
MEEPSKVFRGGSWYHGRAYNCQNLCRAVSSLYINVSEKSIAIGFRVCLRSKE